MRFAWLALLLAACDGGGGGKDEHPTGLSKRALKQSHRDLVTRFADAVVRKDYSAAYGEMSDSYRKDVGWEEFRKSIGRYREQATAPPTYGLWATEDDPKKIADDSVVQLFVPEALRGRIVEEAAIHFQVKDGGDVEGFWALICWIVEEGGVPRILNYYQDD
jgi:hypothetical protein